MKDKTQMSVGVRFCSNCEYNLKCEECVYKGNYEILLTKHEYVLDEAKRAKLKLDNAQSTIKHLTNENDSLKNAGYALDIQTVKREATKAVIEMLRLKLLKIPQHHFSLLAVEETMDKVLEEMAGDTK